MADLYYLPQNGDDLENVEIAEARMPSYTWRVDANANTVRGYTDEADALAQAIYHILSIERYMWPIYPQSYGSEIADLIGKPRDYAAAELRRTISEALLQDDRVTDVGGWEFVFGNDKNALTVSFSVTSVFGAFEIRGDLTR